MRLKVLSLIALFVLALLPATSWLSSKASAQAQGGGGGLRGQQPAQQGGRAGGGGRANTPTFPGPPAGMQALPTDMFTSKNFYKDKDLWSDKRYFRCNT